MVIHTNVENTLLSLPLAYVVEKPGSRGRKWSAEQVSWQADHLFRYPPQRVVGRCFPSQYLVDSLPRVEFQPSRDLCKFLRSVVNKGEMRHRDGISRRGDWSMHAPIVTQNRAEAVTFM